MKSKGLKKFIKEFPICWENYNNDNELDSTKKKIFLDYLDAWDEKDDLISLINKFKQNSDIYFLGALCSDIDKSTIVGHLYTKNRIEEILNLNVNIGISPSSSLVLDDIANIHDEAFKIEEIKFRWGHIPMALPNRLIWCFKNSLSDNDPFLGTKINDLPCILGLDVNYEWIGYGYKIINTELHNPTFYDSVFNEKWIPGGFSKPLLECSLNYTKGFREAIHKSITFDEITIGFKKIKYES